MTLTPALGFGVHKGKHTPKHNSSCTLFFANACENEEGRFLPYLNGESSPCCRGPWLTPILGTGCAPEQVNPTTLHQVIRGLHDAAVHINDALGVFTPDNAIDFAIDLASERLAKDRLKLKKEVKDYIEKTKDPTEETDMSSQTADVFELALRLTHLFYKLKIRTGAAPRRTIDDDFVYLDDSLLDFELIYNYYIYPSLNIISVIQKENNLDTITNQLTFNLIPSAGRNLAEFTIHLKTRLQIHIARTKRGLDVGLDQCCLYWSDVQWWAEIAWLMIAAQARHNDYVPVYPGWSDLLLELCCYVSIEENNYSKFPPVVGRIPFSSIVSGRELIESKARDIQDRLNKRENDKQTVHNTIAKLLYEQAYLREIHPKNHDKYGPGEPPVASAFVTSFDLDLELALLRKIEIGKKILIAFPVYLSLKDCPVNVAYTCWLALEVKRINELSSTDDLVNQQKQLIEPSLENFSVLSKAEIKEKHCPVIVRLAGCPLIKIPEIRWNDKGDNTLLEQLQGLYSNIFSVGPDEFYSSLKLEHAFIISEHCAAVHNIIDLLQTGSNGMTDGSGRGNSPGLSADVAVSGKGWTRFWSLLGVQIRENAIRQRLETLMSVLPRDDGRSESDKQRDEGRSAPDKQSKTNESTDYKQSTDTSSLQNIQFRGMAINHRVSALDADFLSWNRLFIIKDSVDKFSEFVDRQIESLVKAKIDGLDRYIKGLSYATQELIESINEFSEARDNLIIKNKLKSKQDVLKPRHDMAESVFHIMKQRERNNTQIIELLSRMESELQRAKAELQRSQGELQQ